MWLSRKLELRGQTLPSHIKAFLFDLISFTAVSAVTCRQQLGLKRSRSAYRRPLKTFGCPLGNTFWGGNFFTGLKCNISVVCIWWLWNKLCIKAEREKKRKENCIPETIFGLFTIDDQSKKKNETHRFLIILFSKCLNAEKKELTNDKNCWKFVKNLDYRKHLDESHD